MDGHSRYKYTVLFNVLVQIINNFFFMQVPLNMIRMFPDGCAELRDHPSMAYKFLLGDVMVPVKNTTTLMQGKACFCICNMLKVSMRLFDVIITRHQVSKNKHGEPVCLCFSPGCQCRL